MPSAFEELCRERGIASDEWRRSLASPIIAEKPLIDMSEDEILQHYAAVEERARTTAEDRALILLERTQDGRLERQAVKVFDQNAKDGVICADDAPAMLEALRFEISNTEAHYLLRKFDATEGYDMIPERQLTRRQWFWLVGETQLLKETYRHINPEAFEICYEALIRELIERKEAGRAPEPWPEMPVPTSTPVVTVLRPGYRGPLKPHSWALQQDVERELFRQLEQEGERRHFAAPPQTL
mmetsp:Transcript_60324/g.174113  ORF Transcript_60324/g.174113 Transcript_60324/m.174113 type:complete len:241 (+) Transcript_60324:89-811(+)